MKIIEWTREREIKKRRQPLLHWYTVPPFLPRARYYYSISEPIRGAQHVSDVRVFFLPPCMQSVPSLPCHNAFHLSPVVRLTVRGSEKRMSWNQWEERSCCRSSSVYIGKLRSLFTRSSSCMRASLPSWKTFFSSSFLSFFLLPERRFGGDRCLMRLTHSQERRATAQPPTCCLFSLSPPHSIRWMPKTDDSLFDARTPARRRGGKKSSRYKVDQ